MKVRWWVCFLLFLTWLVSYIDRSLMPMAIPFIGREFQLKPAVMGGVLSAFFAGYALMQIPGGLIADRWGPRKSIVFGISAWSVFSILTGMAGGLASLIAIRVMFGLAEGIHAPSAFKALSAWFPPVERARANGLVMCSNTVGPMVTPVLFAVIMAAFGWRSAFLLISLPGFLTALAVYWYLRDRPADHPHITAREVAEIGAPEKPRQRASAGALLKYPARWRIFFAYMMWDVCWWGFQAWLPSYLLSRGFTLLRIGAVAALPYAAGVAGLLLSSYISDRTRRRKPVLTAVLLGIAVCMLALPAARSTAGIVALLMGAGFFLPALHGPFWSIVMDLLPASIMGFSAGFINTGGQIAGLVAPIVIGALIQWTGKYEAGFLFMAAAATVSMLLTLTLPESRGLARSASAALPAGQTVSETGAGVV